MANIKSAKKRILVSNANAERNKAIKSGVKTSVKKVYTAIEAGDKTAAAEAIANAEIETRTVDEEYTFSFEYPLMNSVLKVAREMNARIVSQSYDMDCQMTLSIRRGKLQELQEKIKKALSPF